MGDVLPKFKAAVVQASSILYDRDQCLEKAVALIEETAAQGAEVVAMPESFIPGYPYHVWLGTPMWYHPLFVEWFFNNVEIPSDTVTALCDAARANDINVVIGISERDGNTCYNTQLFISRKGELLGKHRKLMPTHVERVHWGNGTGADLRTFDFGDLQASGLICWEHTMDLARHALIAKRPQLHFASWVGFSSVVGWEDLFDMSTELCARYHAHVGECFVLNSQSTIDAANVEKLSETDYQSQWINEGGGWSAIIGPGGAVLAGPLKGEEGILYAEVDLNAIANMAHWHDAVGHYARPDVVSLLVNDHDYPVTRPMVSAPVDQMMKAANGAKGNGALMSRLAEDIEHLSAEVEALKDVIRSQRIPETVN